MGCRKIRNKKPLVLLVALYFMMSMTMNPAVFAQPATDSDAWVGPYVDTIRYVYINGTFPKKYERLKLNSMPLKPGDQIAVIGTPGTKKLKNSFLLGHIIKVGVEMHVVDGGKRLLHMTDLVCQHSR